MHSTAKRISVVTAILMAFHSTVIFGASITITTPAAGRNFAVGAGISYSGYGSWVLAGNNLEPRTGYVKVDLVYGSEAAQPKYGQGAITDTDYAKITHDVDATGHYDGNYSFINSVNAQTGNSNLVADQFRKEKILYYLFSTPQTIKQYYITTPEEM